MREVRHHGALVLKTPFVPTAQANSTKADTERQYGRHTNAKIFPRAAERSRGSALERFDARREACDLARGRASRDHAARCAALQLRLRLGVRLARRFLVARAERCLDRLHGTAHATHAGAVHHGAAPGLPNSFFR